MSLFISRSSSSSSFDFMEHLTNEMILSSAQPRLDDTALESLGARSIKVLDTSSIQTADSFSDQGTRSSDSSESDTLSDTMRIGTRFNDYESYSEYEEVPFCNENRIIITSGVTGVVAAIGCTVGAIFCRVLSS